MLWTKIDEDGNLTIQANEPIEAFALRQWEKARKTGHAKLIIETGTLFSLEKLLESMGKDLVEFKRYSAERKRSVLLTPEQTKILEI